MKTICPSSEWQAIQTFLDFANDLLPLSYQSLIPPITPVSIEVIGNHSLRRLWVTRVSAVNPGPGYDGITAVGTSQHAAVSDALTSTASLWSWASINVTTRGHGSLLGQLDAVHSITKDYFQPYTIASCQYDVIQGPNDDRPVAFPVPPGSTVQMLNVTAFDDSLLASHAFEYAGISRSEIHNTPGPPGDSRLRWVELPQNPFNGTAIGAVVFLPRSASNLTQEVLMCNVGAGWGASKLNTSTTSGGPASVLSRVSTTMGANGTDPYSRKSTDISDAESSALTIGGGYFALPFFPQRPITITEDWATYLNPPNPDENTTIFNSLMLSNLTGAEISITARIVLAGLVANGLSRIGSTSEIQGTPRTVTNPDGSVGLDGSYWFSGKGDMFEVDPAQSKDWVKLHVSSTVEGYAYNTRGTAPKTAIFFMLAYCIVAIAHIIYAGVSGISSTCWDSIAEVTALAINSNPTTALRNTCAGITELNIFKLPVRVLAKKDIEGDGEHLELVFGRVDEKTIEQETIRPDRVYGTMPLLTPQEKFLRKIS